MLSDSSRRTEIQECEPSALGCLAWLALSTSRDKWFTATKASGKAQDSNRPSDQ